MTTSHPKVSHHGVYPEPQSLIPHFQVYCPNYKKTDVITKFCITVLTLETLSQFATKLCVGRLHLFLKKREIVWSWHGSWGLLPSFHQTHKQKVSVLHTEGRDWYVIRKCTFGICIRGDSGLCIIVCFFFFTCNFEPTSLLCDCHS
jgi:hypothetical protein